MNNFTRIYFLTVGLHPPWNWGETVVTRNILFTMRNYLDIKPKVYSSIDKSRNNYLRTFSDIEINYITSFNIYIYTLTAFTNIVRDLLVESQETNALIHTVGINEAIIWGLLQVMRKVGALRNKIYILTHNYGPVPRKIEIFPYKLHLLLRGKIFHVLTTSFISYKMFSNEGKGSTVRLFYVPPPYIPTRMIASTECEGYRACKQLRGVIARVIERNSDVILYMGPIREKRFPYPLVLSAVKRLIQMGYRDVLLLIISQDDYNSIKNSLNIIKLAKTFHIINHVHIVRGVICEYCKEKILNLSKIFLFLPTHTRQSMDPPISVLEAMANGNVVIATNYLSLPYIIKPFFNGILLNYLTTEKLALEISKLLSKDNYYQQISENSINYIRKNHSPSTVAVNLKNLYEHITL